MAGSLLSLASFMFVDVIVALAITKAAFTWQVMYASGRTLLLFMLVYPCFTITGYL